jgi:Bacterial-like globin
VISFVGKQRLQVSEGVPERAEADCLVRRGKQPCRRLGLASAGQPMARNQRGRRSELGQPLRSVAMHFESLMRRNLLDQRLADQFVAEAVARVRDDEHSSGERKIEQCERLRLGPLRQGDDGRRIECVAGEREALEQRQRGRQRLMVGRGGTPWLKRSIDGSGAPSASPRSTMTPSIAMLSIRFSHRAPGGRTCRSFKQLGVQFFCAGAGGPRKYEGRDLRTAHAGMNISEQEFLATIDDFVAAMNGQGVAPSEVNEVVAILYSMKGEVLRL